jgi:transposase
MEERVRPCPGCLERDRVNAELSRRVADLEGRLAQREAELLQRIAELERRLDDKERAGKRQAAPFSKGPPKKRGKKPGRKAGADHGPHGHRPPPPAAAIDETLEAPLPEACPHCGGAIAEDDAVDEQFQTDIPMQPVQRKFRIHKGTCQCCGRRLRGRHALQTSDATGAAQSQLGPNAQAGIVYLNKRSGMSYGKIADFFKEANGIDLKPSTATRIVLRAAAKLQPVYDEIKESLKTSEVIVPDETGWRKGGRPVWLHTWVGDQATCYVIDPHRSADALEKVIGLGYSGTLVHDGFASYDRFLEAIHQGCVGHILRRAHDLEERHTGSARRFPRQVIDLMQEALGLRADYGKGVWSREELFDAYAEYCDRMQRLTLPPRRNQANDTFAGHLNRHGPSWFAFLLDPDRVPATNHQAEQALRTPIVNRKVFGGNRTDAGCQAQVVTSSTIQTCKQQKRTAFTFIRDTVCGMAQSIITAMTGPQPSAPTTTRD